MLLALSLVRYLKGLCSFVPYLKLLNAELVVATSADEFNCVFIDNGQDLQYKKLSWFLSVRRFLYSGLQLQKRKSQAYCTVLNCVTVLKFDILQ